MVRLSKSLEHVVRTVFEDDNFSLKAHEKHLTVDGNMLLRELHQQLHISDRRTDEEGLHNLDYVAGDSDTSPLATWQIPADQMRKYEEVRLADNTVNLQEVYIYDHFTFVPLFLAESFSLSTPLSRQHLATASRAFLILRQRWLSTSRQTSVSQPPIKLVLDGDSKEFGLFVELITDILGKLGRSFVGGGVQTERSFLVELHAALYAFVCESCLPRDTGAGDILGGSRLGGLNNLLSASQVFKEQNVEGKTSQFSESMEMLQIGVWMCFLLSSNLLWTAHWQAWSREKQRRITFLDKQQKQLSYHSAKTEATLISGLLEQLAKAERKQLRHGTNLGYLWQSLKQRITRLWVTMGHNEFGTIEEVTATNFVSKGKILPCGYILMFPLNLMVLKESRISSFQVGNENQFQVHELVGLSQDTLELIQIESLWNLYAKGAFLKLVSRRANENQDCTQALEICKRFIQEANRRTSSSVVQPSSENKTISISLAAQVGTVLNRLSIMDTANNSLLTDLSSLYAWLLQISQPPQTSSPLSTGTNGSSYPPVVLALLLSVSRIGCSTWDNILNSVGHKPNAKGHHSQRSDEQLSEIVCKQ